MATITEHDVITFLESKIAALLDEISRIRLVTEYFTGIAPAAPKPAALKTLKKKPLKRKKQKQVKMTAQPGVGEISAPPVPLTGLEDNILAMLSLGPAYINDIISSAQALHAGAEPQRVENAVINTLFVFKKNGRVASVQEGKKYRYSLQAVAS
ncbi:hypothetical protein [Hufsiella ginkgonis]|uniref:Uncharacterized protein n=1 Tax=Hufsiella ginkgonis TaxID=2695274 RepID=A0A7K1Y0J9_9SPHI|nr:hypothetical protein [Hufsiella ginkgonis]MXV16753.1 hypothetical protein [Hufsiella ginkgonis]